MTSDDLRLIPGARVLVADDHERHVELLDGYLSAVGHDCLHAYDGEEALRRLRSDAPELLLLEIGTVGVRESILQKRGSLTPEEYEEIKKHPLIGETLCAALRCADDIGPVIRYHQERWDGQGYPDGLKGEQIPLLARVMAVADGYAALTSERPYRS